MRNSLSSRGDTEAENDENDGGDEEDEAAPALAPIMFE